jgi:pimeloyl-ACP methyl ester carboxylesterase
MEYVLGIAPLVLAALIGAGLLITSIAARRIEAAHPPVGRFVDVDGGRLHVLDLAPRTDTPNATTSDALWPVVLIHGASGNMGDLRFALGDRLARTRRVVLVDRPGHGWSDRPGGKADASPARQAALIAQALDGIGLDRFVLVGHSLGGTVAAAFARAYPERVAGLVLLAAVTHPWKGWLDWHYNVGSTPIVGPAFARAAALPVGEVLLEMGARKVFLPQAMPADYLARAGIRLLLRPAEFVANAQDVAALRAFVTREAPHYRDLTMPSVVLTGDADTTVSPTLHSRAIAAQLPDARLVILPGIGHMPQHVATDEVIAAIDSVSMRQRSASPRARGEVIIATERTSG